MERLTTPGYRYYDDEFMDSGVAKYMNRLSAYEDSGLEPEEITDFMKRWERAVEIAELCKKGGIDHLLELKKAENEGRLVVLPCIPGSDIYYLNNIDREIVPMVLLGFDILPTVVMAQTNYGQSIPVSQFGETVFLTREEAEAALIGKDSAVPDASEEPAELEWKNRMMQTFLRGSDG